MINFLSFFLSYFKSWYKSGARSTSFAVVHRYPLLSLSFALPSAVVDHRQSPVSHRQSAITICCQPPFCHGKNSVSSSQHSPNVLVLVSIQPLFLRFQLWLRDSSPLLSLILFLHHCLLPFIVGTGCGVQIFVGILIVEFVFQCLLLLKVDTNVPNVSCVRDHTKK